MVFKDFIIVQFIDSVTAGKHYIRFMALLKEVQILIKRVCRASVPVAALGCDSRRENIHTPLLSAEIPPFGRA